ncbi:MAG: antibiotic biosynthesis monooxygenase [Parvibaculum sp.]|nr:antibiotic biosynthesis monooxygenase [Parvibaculum sp.]
MSDKKRAMRVARTPKPPYYSVTTSAELDPSFDDAAHYALGLALYAHAMEIGGFLGLEACNENGGSIAVSYWESLEAIECWRQHPEHMKAKARGKSGWFGATITRIARVEADYGFNLD